jgi:hypothetical protein
MPDIFDASPNPASHIKTLMRIGYDLPTAVADILDNSITAEASEITISCLNEAHQATFRIVDDGYGMTSDELKANMRISCRDPDESSVAGDLGRFGSGLKTASFSQARKLVVIAKKEGSPRAGAFWDIDVIIKTNRWDLHVLNDSEIEDIVGSQYLNDNEHGTCVIWERLNAFSSNDINRPDPDELVAEICNELHEHIGLHFHKFIEKNKPRILLNNIPIVPLDPFMKDVRQYQEAGGEKKRVRLQEGGSAPLEIVAHVLPPLSGLERDVIKKYGSEDKIREGQGFYIYREKRLIIAGGWWGIRPRNGLDALARIEVRITRDFDSEWGTDVKKGSFQIPLGVKNELKRYATASVKRSRKSHRYQGKQALVQNYWEEFVNERENWVRFQVKKNNDELECILSECDAKTRRKLLEYLLDIGTNLPIQAIHAHLLERQQSVRQDGDFEALKKAFLEAKANE